MKKSYVLIIACVSLLLSVATPAEDNLLKEIDAGNQAFAKAVVAGDVETLVDSYTKDACILAPSAPLTCGEESIRAFWAAVVASNPKNVAIETLGVGSEGNLAHAYGNLNITDAADKLHENQFVLVLKNADGDWKLHLDTWTPSP